MLSSSPATGPERFFSTIKRGSLTCCGFVKTLTLAGLMFMGVGLVALGEEEKPKFTIKQIMNKAMKGGLCTKVASDKASDAEKQELILLFTALVANTPPKGDAADWKEKTTTLLACAKSGDGAKLKKAANCAACHMLYKGK